MIQQLKALCVARRQKPILDLEDGSLAVELDPWAVALGSSSDSDAQAEGSESEAIVLKSATR